MQVQDFPHNSYLEKKSPHRLTRGKFVLEVYDC